MGESQQDKLRRVRPPRVQIKYEVVTDGAREIKELPFVVGVMGDFSGDPTKELPEIEDRKFVNIDRDNINDVMKSMTPGLKISVDNTLEPDSDKQMSVDLKFESMDDFSPAQVAQQIPELRELLQMRQKLKDLAINVDRKRDLEKVLDQILNNPEKQDQLMKELGIDSGSSDGGE